MEEEVHSEDIRQFESILEQLVRSPRAEVTTHDLLSIVLHCKQAFQFLDTQKASHPIILVRMSDPKPDIRIRALIPGASLYSKSASHYTF